MFSTAITDPTSLPHEIRTQRPEGPAGFAEVLGDVITENTGGRASERNKPDLYTIRSGDTIFGIAKARLLDSGKKATPTEILRLASIIARDNRIRNWDRIYAGRTLNLGPVISLLRTTPAKGKLMSGANDSPNEPTAIQVIAANHALAPYVIDSPPAISAGGNQSQDSAEPKPTAHAPNADETGSPVTGAEATVNARAIGLYEESDNSPKNCSPGPLSDIAYKGLVGKLLDAVPLESPTRTTLQQANAIASGSMTGRSVATMIGITNPLFAVAGFFWGLFSANRISSASAVEPPPSVDCAK